MLTVTCLLLLAQPQSSVDATPAFEFGHLRYVQLLQPRDGKVRFATQYEVGVEEPRYWYKSTNSVIAVYEGESKAPVSQLSIGKTLATLEPTWTRRHQWHLFELEGVAVLAVVVFSSPPGSAGYPDGDLHVLSFPDGEERERIRGVLAIEDALVHDGEGTLLVRQKKVLRMLRLSKGGELLENLEVDLGFDSVACATLLRGEAALGRAGWAIGFEGRGLFAYPFGNSDRGRRLSVKFTEGNRYDYPLPGTSIRCTAWASNQEQFLAIAWPGYNNGVGKFQVLRQGTESEKLWEGPDPEGTEGSGLFASVSGQAIRFLPDADGDEIPDILATGPWTLGPRVDLLSGGSGRCLKSWESRLLAGNVGYCLSLNPDYSFLMVGGADEVGYPENLGFPGIAYLLQVPEMEKAGAWRIELQPK